MDHVKATESLKTKLTDFLGKSCFELDGPNGLPRLTARTGHSCYLFLPFSVHRKGLKWAQNEVFEVLRKIVSQKFHDFVT